MLASSEVKTFLILSFNRKKKVRLSNNSALNKNDYEIDWLKINNCALKV